jgi:hypothetical protein
LASQDFEIDQEILDPSRIRTRFAEWRNQLRSESGALREKRL